MALSFERAKVSDAMTVGVFWCPPDTPLAGLARTLATYSIHCVLIGQFERRYESDSPWGIVSDLDIMAAAARRARQGTAWSVARTPPVTITAEEQLERAAELMAEHKVAHLVVVHRDSGHPVGVLSTLDIAGVLGGGTG